MSSQDVIGANRSAKNRAAVERRHNDLAWLMDDERGRRIVSDLLAVTGVYRTSFTGDQVATIFNEGQRNVGLQLLRDVQGKFPTQFMLMLQEQTNAA